MPARGLFHLLRGERGQDFLTRGAEKQNMVADPIIHTHIPFLIAANYAAPIYVM